MPKLVDITDGEDIVTKPLSRQTSVQSNKSVNSAITTVDVSENQSSPVNVSTPTEAMSRTPSIKRDSMISRGSTSGAGDQEPLIEQTETTELLCES
jgi:hypothetical protein